VGAAVYQINVLIVTLLASFLPEGSVSYLWYADRVSEFPLGIFAIAVATATLPTLSKHATGKDMVSFKETMNFGLRLSFLIAIPSAVGLYLLATPVVEVLFQRGQFDQATAYATAGALAFFALKIPFVSGVRNLVPGFFALRDAKTPVIVSGVAVVVNVACALLLMKPLLHRGLALALVVSSAVNFFLLLGLFRRKVGLIGGRGLAASLAKTCVASAIMALAIIVARNVVGPTAEMDLWEKAGVLILYVVGGATIFIAVTRIINEPEYIALKGLIRRRKVSAVGIDTPAQID
jgi:putative peptidoglycan lipid II flippase